MKRQHKIFLFSFLSILFLGSFLFLSFAWAQGDTFGLQPVGDNIGLGGDDIRLTIARIIRAILGLLGIIALVIVLYGGFVYMTANGNEEKISQAKKILINGAIGLAIILSSFAIAQFVLNKLSEATNPTNTDPRCEDDEYLFYHQCYCEPTLEGCDGTGPGCRETLRLSKTFVLLSITPVTEDTGMNNVKIRAIFNQPIESSWPTDKVFQIFKDKQDVTADFDFNLLAESDSKVVEAVYQKDKCPDTDIGCLDFGNYFVEVTSTLRSVDGKTITVGTECGDFPLTATSSIKYDADNNIYLDLRDNNTEDGTRMLRSQEDGVADMGDNFTLSFWTKQSSNDWPVYAMPFNNMTGGGKGYRVKISSVTRNYIFELYDTNSKYSSFLFQPSADYDFTLWHHIAVAFGASPESGVAVKFYIDGEKIGEKNIPTYFQIKPFASKFTLAAAHPDYFNGFIDGFRLYDRVLSENEIKILTEDRETTSIQEGLKVGYNFNENNNSVISDFSGNNHNADLVNGATIVSDKIISKKIDSILPTILKTANNFLRLNGEYLSNGQDLTGLRSGIISLDAIDNSGIGLLNYQLDKTTPEGTNVKLFEDWYGPLIVNGSDATADDPFTYEELFSTRAGNNFGLYNLFFKIWDIDSNFTTTSLRLLIIPDHCSNGDWDFDHPDEYEDEEDTDCGGSCPACPGSGCTEDWQCAKGNKCIDKICIASPQIIEVDPMHGAAGNWISIYGRNFGSGNRDDVVGNGVFFDLITPGWECESDNPPSDPVLNWKIDEGTSNVINDSSENSYNGLAENVVWGEGDNKTFLTFNGKNSSVSGPASNSIVGDNVEEVTMSAWFKTNSNKREYIAALKMNASNIGDSTLFALTIGYNGAVTPGSAGLLTRGADDVTHYWLEDDSKAYNDGEWHHLVGVIDNPTRTVYIDGAKVLEDQRGIKKVVGNDGIFTVGNFKKNSYTFTGDIDNVQVFDRALSADEVVDLYKSTQCHWIESVDIVEAQVVDSVECGNSWTDSQIVVEVPDDVSLPINSQSAIRVLRANGLFDSTNDDFGPKPNGDGLFKKDTEKLPGLCSVKTVVDPGVVGATAALPTTPIKIVGKGLENENTTSRVLFFDDFDIAYNSWTASTIFSRVPNINIFGETGVSVEVDGKKSNSIKFEILTPDDLDANPVIEQIDPVTTTPGSYITISGSGFGSLGSIFISPSSVTAENCAMKDTAELPTSVSVVNLLQDSSFENTLYNNASWLKSFGKVGSGIFEVGDAFEGEKVMRLCSFNLNCGDFNVVGQQKSGLESNKNYTGSAYMRLVEGNDAKGVLIIQSQLSNLDKTLFWNFVDRSWDSLDKKVYLDLEDFGSDKYIYKYDISDDWDKYEYSVNVPSGFDDISFYWGGSSNEFASIEIDNLGLEETSFDNCTELDLDSFPVECGNTWENNQIIAKIPLQTNSGKYFLALRNGRGYYTAGVGVDGLVNKKPLSIENGEPLPGICGLSPDSGIAPRLGDNKITLYGDNFVSGNNLTSVYFWTNNASSTDMSTWMNTAKNVLPVDSIKTINNKKIETNIPYINLNGSRLDGTSMQSGPIRVGVDGRFSNKIKYTVSDCRVASESEISSMVGDDYQCCEAAGPDEGKWKLNRFVCIGETRDAGYVWRFSTGEINVKPRVLVQCDETNWSTPSFDGKYPSPTPSTLWSTGKTACTNSTVAVKFNIPIDSTTINSDNVKIYKCGSGGDTKPSCSTDDLITTNEFFPLLTGENVLEIRKIPPDSNLDPNTWYHIELSTAILSAEKSTTVGDLASEQYNLQVTAECVVDGVNNCVDNDIAYYFDFKTADYDCQMTGAEVEPKTYTTHYLGKLYSPDGVPPNPLYYVVWGFSDKKCISLSADQYAWDWQTNIGGILNISNSPPDYLLNSTSRVELDALAEHPGVQVSASAGVDLSSYYEVNALQEIDREGGLAVNTTTDVVEVANFSGEDFAEFDSYEIFIQYELNELSEADATKHVYQTTHYLYQKENVNYFAVSEKHLNDDDIGDVMLLSNLWDPNGNLTKYSYQANWKKGYYRIVKTGNNIKVYDLYGDPDVPIVNEDENISGTDYSLPAVFGVKNFNSKINTSTLLNGTITKFDIIKENLFSVEDGAITATNTTTVSLYPPAVIDYGPNCAEACVNSSIWAKFNRPMVQTTYNGNIELFRCEDGEKCLTTSTHQYVDRSQTSDDLVIRADLLPNELLATSTWYLAVIKGGENGVKAIGSASGQVGKAMPEDFVWKFRTKSDPSPCKVDNVKITPDPFVTQVIGEQTKYSAIPRSQPDQCSSVGQELNPWSYGWSWIADDENVAVTTNFSLGTQISPYCNFGCLLKGSNYSSDTENVYLCGNGTLDPGEDCDIGISGEVVGVSCTLSCLRPGNNLPTCGNGTLEKALGEECDPGGNKSTWQFCTQNCLNAGSSQDFPDGPTISWCGSGNIITDGEDCDLKISLSETALGEENQSNIGCSENCLHLGTSLARSWCDDNPDYAQQCKSAISFCGNEIVESGEECEIVRNETDDIGIKFITAMDPAITTGFFNIPTSSYYCNNNCLLQNTCGLGGIIAYKSTSNPNGLRCLFDLEGCSSDCTLAGSSISYVEASLCGDGNVGVGEMGFCEVDNGDIPSGVITGNPVQRVYGFGLGLVENRTLNGQTFLGQYTTIKATVESYFSIEGGESVPLSLLANARVTGSGDYYIACGFEEYASPNSVGGVSIYNQCPLSAGQNNETYGVADNSCCYERPFRIGSYPVDSTGFSADEPVCPNTMIEFDFNNEIDKNSIENNFIIAVGHTDPNYGCAQDGLLDVSDVINNSVSTLAKLDNEEGFLQKIWNFVKKYFVRIFGSDAYATEQDLTGMSVWCAGDISASSDVLNHKNIEDQVVTSTVKLYLNSLLPTNSYVAIYLKGGNKGITDIRGVGIRNNPAEDKSMLQDSIVFRTGPEVCKIDNVVVDPDAYLFTKPNSTSTFEAVIKTKSEQRITNIPGQYDWTMEWQPQNNEIVNIPESGYSSTTPITTFGVNNLQGSLVAVANVKIIEDKDVNSSDEGMIFTGITYIEVNFCENPWPARDDQERWSSFKDETYNFSMSYCADDGLSGNSSDDFPYLEVFDLTEQTNEVSTMVGVFTTPDKSIETQVTGRCAVVPQLGDHAGVYFGVLRDNYNWDDQTGYTNPFLSLDCVEDTDCPVFYNMPYSNSSHTFDVGGLCDLGKTAEELINNGCTINHFPVGYGFCKAGQYPPQYSSEYQSCTADTDCGGDEHCELGLPGTWKANNECVGSEIITEDLSLPTSGEVMYWNMSWSYDVPLSTYNIYYPVKSSNLACVPINQLTGFLNGDSIVSFLYDNTIPQKVFRISAPSSTFVWADDDNLLVRGIYFIDNDKYFKVYNCEEGDQVSYAENENISFVTAGSPNLTEDTLKRLILFNDKNDDIVGVQIFKNSAETDVFESKSIRDWYADRFDNLSAMQTIEVAGYEGLTDGRNYYINALNETPDGGIYSNVYLFAVNKDAQQSTLKVFEKLLNSLKFNINITDHGACLASEVNVSDGLPKDNSINTITSVDCNTDFDCRDLQGVPLAGTNGVCSDAKTKMFRDWARLPKIGALQNKIIDLKFPQLKSGTYLPGYSVSKWPTSWSIFGTQDEINAWVGCDTNENVDSYTCWDAISSTYHCPTFSSVYEYEFVPPPPSSTSTGYYKLHGPLEYFRDGSPMVDYFIDEYYFTTEPWCISEINYPPIVKSPFGAKCGDGIVNPGEECDPVGKKITSNSGYRGITPGICKQGERERGSCFTDDVCEIETILKNNSGDEFRVPTPSSTVVWAFNYHEVDGNYVPGTDPNGLFVKSITIDSMGYGLAYYECTGSSLPSSMLSSLQNLKIWNKQVDKFLPTYPVIEYDVTSYPNSMVCISIGDIDGFLTEFNPTCEGEILGDQIYSCPSDEVSYKICSDSCQWQSTMCTPKYKCGNGIVEPGEACDDGVLNGTYGQCAGENSFEGQPEKACKELHPQYCGNTYIDSNENGNPLEVCEVVPSDSYVSVSHLLNGKFFYITFRCNTELLEANFPPLQSPYLSNSDLEPFTVLLPPVLVLGPPPYNSYAAAIQLARSVQNACKEPTGRCFGDHGLLCRDNGIYDCFSLPKDYEMVYPYFEETYAKLITDESQLINDFGDYPLPNRVSSYNGICDNNLMNLLLPPYSQNEIDSCAWDCQSHGAYCGDGIRQSDYEECDDGNDIEQDGCNNLCQKENLLCKQQDLFFTTTAISTVFHIADGECTPTGPSVDSTKPFSQCVLRTNGKEICRAYGLNCSLVTGCGSSGGPSYEYLELGSPPAGISCEMDLTWIGENENSYRVICNGIYTGPQPEVEVEEDEPICGNSIVDSEAGEVCDMGLASNGLKCTPSYGKSCTYCSADCKNILTVDSQNYCGNNEIDCIEYEPGSTTECKRVEKCDGTSGTIKEGSLNPNGTIAQTTKTCTDMGYYVCSSDCLILDNECVDCRILDDDQSKFMNGAVAKVNIINVLEPNGPPYNNFFYNNVYLRLMYNKISPFNIQALRRLATNPPLNPIPFFSNSLLTSPSPSVPFVLSALKNNNPLKITTNQICNENGYSLDFVSIRSTNSFTEAGDSFEYPVKGEVEEVVNDYVVSPALPTLGQFRAVIRWGEDYAGVNFTGAVYNEGFLWSICRTPLLNYFSGFDPNCAVDNMVKFHPIRMNTKNNVQAVTIDTNELNYKYDYAFAVQQTLKPYFQGIPTMAPYKDSDLYVEIYKNKPFTSDYLFYKPDYVVKIKEHTGSPDNSFNFWHVFDLVYNTSNEEYSVEVVNMLQDESRLSQSLKDGGVLDDYVRYSNFISTTSFKFVNDSFLSLVTSTINPHPLAFVLRENTDILPALIIPKIYNNDEPFSFNNTYTSMVDSDQLFKLGNAVDGEIYSFVVNVVHLKNKVFGFIENEKIAPFIGFFLNNNLRIFPVLSASSLNWQIDANDFNRIKPTDERWHFADFFYQDNNLFMNIVDEFIP